MIGADAAELRLIEAADGVELTQVDLTEMTQLLEDWLSTLKKALLEHRLHPPESLNNDHVLVQKADEINALLNDCSADWTHKWELLGPAKLLAQAFDDQVMLLVFGKFNAGKSSLCNLVAERFSAHGRAVKYFHIEAGHIVRTTQPFQEGATETTARLQGVTLGHSIVLLDTPGLHSVTPENAALTQRFTDSADAVLWLTSSTSPGQVQELNEMARELHRNKPLLPIITRSDVIEEDELAGAIVKVLINKSAANRQLQEDDVRSRSLNKLAEMGVPSSVLEAPVSVSAHVMREHGQTPQAVRESGFTRLYTAVLGLIEPARAYKQRKPVEVLLHHLEESVLGSIRLTILPALTQLLNGLSQERERLQMLEPHLTKLVWRQVVSELPRMLEHHANALDIEELCREPAELLHTTLAHEVSLRLTGYVTVVPQSANLATDVSVALGHLSSGADDRVVKVSVAESVASVVSDHERLHDALKKSIERMLARQVSSVFVQCSNAMDEIGTATSSLREVLARQDDALIEVKRQLRRSNG